MTDSTYEIVIRCKSGDMKAFQLLVEEYHTYAYRLALRILCSEEEAKDVVQESFIRVWRHIQKYDLRSKFTTWLYKIVTNLCYDNLKARKRRNRLFQTDSFKMDSNLLASNDDLEKDIGDRELAEVIHNIAEELAPTQRIVFVLRDLQDISIQEVVTITGISKGAVKSNLYHARRHIRKKLEIINHIGEK